MKRHSTCVALFLLTSASVATTGHALDWPQWQGPERNAVSTEQGLLAEWPKDGPPLAWKFDDLGGGYSTPSIAAGRIFGMSNRGDDEVVWALSEETGKTLWVTRIAPACGEGKRQGQEGPGCTPTVDGKRLYVVGAGGDVACLQVEDGKVLWTRSLTRDFGGSIPVWRYNESPLIDGDKLICTPGGQEATIVALDKATGKTVWKSLVPGQPKAAYASPIAVDFSGRKVCVQFTQKAVVGVAMSDGTFLWQYEKPANRWGINCSTPIYHANHVYASSAYGTGGGLVKLDKAPSGTIKAEEAWFSKKLKNHHGGVVLWKGAFYGANGGNEGGFLTCLDFRTGEVLWRERDVSKGAVAFAGDRLYYRTEEGTVLLIEPDNTRYIERGRFEQPDRSSSPAWAHPVIANGRLYLRDQSVLLCYDIRAQKAKGGSPSRDAKLQ